MSPEENYRWVIAEAGTFTDSCTFQDSNASSFDNEQINAQTNWKPFVHIQLLASPISSQKEGVVEN